VKIRKWDIFTEVLDELVEEQYDVVHVKFLVLVVKGDPIPILRKFSKDANLLTNVPQSQEWAEPDALSAPNLRMLKMLCSGSST
jgi:hypothetical protein